MFAGTKGWTAVAAIFVLMFGMGVSLGGATAAAGEDVQLAKENVSSALADSEDALEANATGYHGEIVVNVYKSAVSTGEFAALAGVDVGASVPTLAGALSNLSMLAALGFALWPTRDVVRGVLP